MILPILFSAPMVRAILSGRKTQTRRLWRGQWTKVQPGDLLWVRESLIRIGSPHHGWAYCADNVLISMRHSDPRVSEMIAWAHHKEGNSTPSIHMPRWASRLTLRVVKVRRQRLWDISERDCKAEGVHWLKTGARDYRWGMDRSLGMRGSCPYHAFQVAWDALNAARVPWACNPEVAAVSFEVLRENVDKAAKA